jgi:hypothetical protein
MIPTLNPDIPESRARIVTLSGERVGDDLLDAAQGGEQRQQRRRAFQDHVSLGSTQLGISHELDGISQTLLAIQQEGATREWRTFPAWTEQRPRGRLLPAPTELILAPTFEPVS